MNDFITFSELLVIIDRAISYTFEKHKNIDSVSALNSLGFLRASVVLNQIKTEILKEISEKNEKRD